MRIYFRGILQKLVYTELFLVNQNIHYPKYSKYIFAWLLFSIVFLFLSKKKYCSNIYPFSWSTEMLTQFCSKRLDFSKVVTILLKRNYFRKRFCFFFFFLAKRLWETFVWQFWEILQVTVSLHSSATWMYHLTISLKLTHRIDQSQGLLSKTSHITELIHLWSLPLNLVLWCLYHLKQVELSSVSWCETGTGVIARKSFRWLLYLAKEKWLWLGWG